MAEILRAERCVKYYVSAGNDLNYTAAGVDLFTIASCHAVQEAGTELIVKSEEFQFLFIPTITDWSQTAAECVSEHGKATCASIGGECITERDGYYWVSALGLTFGVAFLLGYIIPTARKLQGKSDFPFYCIFA